MCSLQHIAYYLTLKINLMKKILHILFFTILIYSTSINGMKLTFTANTASSEVNEMTTLAYFAHYHCKSKEKNTLMRLNKQFCACLKWLKNQLEENLFQCTCANNMLMISSLLENGVRINGTNLLRVTIFHSTDHHNEEVMSWLPKYRIPKLSQAVDEGNEEAVKKFLESQKSKLSVNNNAKNFVKAIQNGHISIVQLLINADARTNRPDINGATPLCIAADNGHTEIAELLINNRANVNHKDNQGWTPLCYAAYKGHLETLKLLLKHGAKIDQAITVDSTVDATIKKGDTPLCIAQIKCHILIAEYLQEQLELAKITKHTY